MACSREAAARIAPDCLPLGLGMEFSGYLLLRRLSFLRRDYQLDIRGSMNCSLRCLGLGPIGIPQSSIPCEVGPDVTSDLRKAPSESARPQRLWRSVKEEGGRKTPGAGRPAQFVRSSLTGST